MHCCVLNFEILFFYCNLFSVLLTYDIKMTRHLFGAKAVGDLTDVVATVLKPQVGNGEAGDAPCPAGVSR